jgi:endonuclease/exonuclease/phosphatase family metal-dependent hydrolase
MGRFRSFSVYFLLSLIGAHPAASASSFRVLTFNSWLLPAVLGASKDREIRKNRMPVALASTGADLIGLQEVWTTEDQDFLIAQMADRGYSYSARANSVGGGIFGLGRGLIGNGLLVFSKYEMKSAVHLFSFSGFTRADEYFASKGVIHAEVNLPDLGWVDFYNTHLGAVFFEPSRRMWNSDQLKSHEDQGKELLRFVLQTRTHSTQIITGDLNLHPFEWDSKAGAFSLGHLMPLYAQITGSGPKDHQDQAVFPLAFVDTFHEVNPGRTGAFTYDRELNRYVAEGAFKAEPSLYCDYVLLSRNQGVVAPKWSEIVFDRAFSGSMGSEIGSYFLSDHFGVVTEFHTGPSKVAAGATVESKLKPSDG